MERFWSKVNVKGPDECWLWTASIDSCGYGNFSFEDSLVGSHRMSYELSIEPIPEGLSVLHKCDTRNCVNPNHLFLGTQKDNVRDCIKKERFRSHIGAKNNQAVLSEEKVLKIRKFKRENSWASLMDLAIMYGVSKSAIAHIVKRRTWKHV